MNKEAPGSYPVKLNPQTQFLLSTSGSQSSIEKHNKALQSLGINLAYFTFDHKVTAEQYAGLLKSPIARGGAVTGQGLKVGMLPFLDEVDELGRATRAINTVVNKNGKLYGYNTDGFGLEAALRSHLESSGLRVKNAIIYGNGGVSGVAAHVLKKMNVQTTMTGRNSERVANKMQQLNLDVFQGPYDLVVNATPGSSNDLDQAKGLLDILQDSKVVFDHNMPEKDGGVNYLQRYSKQHSIYFIPGKDMYVAQMIKQWALFLNGYTDGGSDTLRVTEEDIRKHWAL